MMHIRLWSLLVAALGAWLAYAGGEIAAQASTVAAERGGLVRHGGWILLASAALVWLIGEARARRRGTVGTASEAHEQPPGSLLRLFAISFIVLFVEVMLIRYCSSQIRIFSFYKNVPLIGCFLGLGLGCWQGGGRPRHALAFLAWLTPLAAFLSLGSLALADALGRWAVAASSEQILGDFSGVSGMGSALVAQLLMGLFCALTLVAIAMLFTLLGRLMGSAFEGLPRLRAYTVNILGSLVGILAFLGLGYLQTPPWVWFVVGLVPLLAWIRRPRRRVLGIGLVAVNALLVVPSFGHTVWSPYQKLVGYEIPGGPTGAGIASSAYRVEISDVFYQIAMDLRPEAVARMGGNPFPHYDAAYHGQPAPERVLVVGAGTGNDVAAALRAGAGHVDAVDIDPVIVAMGRQHHPERPYDDPRVRVIVDDARRAFRHLEPASYDLVVFGLLDSHTQLGMSSLRLDNYVFTLDSFEAARRLLRPGGRLLISAATFRDWFGQRMVEMLEATCGTEVEVAQFAAWRNYTCVPGERSLRVAGDEDGLVLPTDDWPFLYLPSRSVPRAYLLVVALLALTSIAILFLGPTRVGKPDAFHAHLFFLGAGFLLMEVYAINRLALLFGTTWLVSAVTIALILVLIIGANTVAARLRVAVPLAYGALVVSLLFGYLIGPEWVLGRGLLAELAYGLAVLSPVFFAGLIFARSFGQSPVAGQAIGVNILGSVLGGWVEYGTMAVGIRTMSLVALLCYLASLLAWLRFRDRPTGTEPVV